MAVKSLPRNLAAWNLAHH